MSFVIQEKKALYMSFVIQAKKAYVICHSSDQAMEEVTHT